MQFVCGCVNVDMIFTDSWGVSVSGNHLVCVLFSGVLRCGALRLAVWRPGTAALTVRGRPSHLAT